MISIDICLNHTMQSTALLWPFHHPPYESSASISVGCSIPLVVILVFNRSWLKNSNALEVHKTLSISNGVKHFGSGWEITWIFSYWNIFKSKSGRLRGRCPTWGGWASLFHLHKAVVVCDDVTIFQWLPHILVTLKEQFVQSEFEMHRTTRQTILKSDSQSHKGVWEKLHGPHHLSHTALINGCSAPTKHSLVRWVGPLPVAETSAKHWSPVH